MTTKIDNLYLIVIDEISTERREVIHSLVKAKTKNWWHNLPNVWIVEGERASYWRDELGPVVAGTGASILVFALPDVGAGRNWSFQGPNAKEKVAWLHESYTSTPE